MLLSPATVSFLLQVVARLVDDALHQFSQFAVTPDFPIYFLGKAYQSDELTVPEVTAEFMDDLQSRMFFSYRQGIENFGTYDSDVWWGCSVRSTQMLVAQGMNALLLGRDWRLSANGDRKVFNSIARQFMDTASAPLSIQEIVGTYEDMDMGYAAGEYTSPAVCSTVMSRIWECKSRSVGIMSFKYVDISIPAIRDTLKNHKHGVVILYARRYSLAELTEEYKAYLIEMYKSNPFFQGMVAADFSRAYYVPAVSSSRLYCMDPHMVQPAIKNARQIATRLKPHGTPYAMSWPRLNSQLTLGFSIKSLEELDSFVAWGKEPNFRELVSFTNSNAADDHDISSCSYDGGDSSDEFEHVIRDDEYLKEAESDDIIVVSAENSDEESEFHFSAQDNNEHRNSVMDSEADDSLHDHVAVRAESDDDDDDLVLT